MHEWIADDPKFLQDKIDRELRWRDKRRHFWVSLMAKLRMVL